MANTEPMTARDAETPRDYADVTPRDAVANLAQTFRGMRDQYPDGWTVYPEEFGAWASRLEDACRKLDAEKAQSAGDFRKAIAEEVTSAIRAEAAAKQERENQAAIDWWRSQC